MLVTTNSTIYHDIRTMRKRLTHMIQTSTKSLKKCVYAVKSEEKHNQQLNNYKLSIYPALSNLLSLY